MGLGRIQLLNADITTKNIPENQRRTRSAVLSVVGPSTSQILVLEGFNTRKMAPSPIIYSPYMMIYHNGKSQYQRDGGCSTSGRGWDSFLGPKPPTRAYPLLKNSSNPPTDTASQVTWGAKPQTQASTYKSAS